MNRPLPQLAAGEPFGQAPLASDLQYILILDSSGTILRTLYSGLGDTRRWELYEFDLRGYAGRTVTLHFGTYNDGTGGISSMFVDDVGLEVCP